MLYLGICDAVVRPSLDFRMPTVPIAHIPGNVRSCRLSGAKVTLLVQYFAPNLFHRVGLPSTLTLHFLNHNIPHSFSSPSCIFSPYTTCIA